MEQGLGGDYKIRKWLCILLALLVGLAPAALGEGAIFSYRFADAGEAAELLLGNRDYYENLSQNDLNFRMQKLGATLEELEAFAAGQTLDYTDDEKAAVDDVMALVEAACLEHGYHLPATDGIVFCKTTTAEECDVGSGYTHGTQVYLGQDLLDCGVSDDPENRQIFREVLTHELFHCLTRNHPEFRAAMYAILGFTVEESDYEFAPAIRERIISNPDVEHHNSHAAFDIGGEMRECAVVFTTVKPFEKPGDSFFDEMMAGLVPIDDLSTMYTADDAANFWDVFGENTDYVIDPEETLADNFAFLLTYGLDGLDYETPAIIEAIEDCLSGE